MPRMTHRGVVTGCFISALVSAAAALGGVFVLQERSDDNRQRIEETCQVASDNADALVLLTDALAIQLPIPPSLSEEGKRVFVERNHLLAEAKEQVGDLVLPLPPSCLKE